MIRSVRQPAPSRALMMCRPFAFVLAATGLLALASGCTRSLSSQDAGRPGTDADVHSDASPDAIADHPPACYPLFHACTTTQECCAPNRCLNITGAPACQQEGPAVDAGLPIDAFLPEGIPKADPDGGTCSGLPGEAMGVICFGADPAPYEQYLTPAEGGVVRGQCPTTADFMPANGERCGYIACGPLLGSAVSGLPDASAVEGDAGADCCFLVARLCGV
jgi:hypothetical protein